MLPAGLQNRSSVFGVELEEFEDAELPAKQLARFNKKR
jgi:hypothetical protein